MEFSIMKIEEIANVKGGKRLPKGESLITSPTDHPYIRLVDIENNQVNERDLQYLTSSVYQKISKYIVEEDNVCLAVVGHTIGLVFYINSNMHGANLTENAVRLIIDKKQANPRFIYYYLNSEKGQAEILSRKVGSAQGKLPLYNIKSLEIPLPSLKSQNKIVSILKYLDEKIDNNYLMINNLKQISQILFKHWFIDFEFPNEEGKPYKSSGGEMMESELGEIPKEWSVGKAGDILEFSPKETISKNTLATFVEMKNLNTSAMVYDHIQKPFKSGSKFRNGDTLLARITPCLENGKIGFVDFLTEGEVGWGSTEFITIRTKNDIASSLSYYFASEQNFKNYAIKNMNGSSGRQRVKAETLSNYLIALPPKKLIKKFTDISEENMQMMTKLKEEILTLKQIRDTLLPKLLSGEIEIPDDLEV